MAKSVTLADIGKRAGVSAVTVSKALSGQTGVSEEMRQTILRLADEMGYKRPVKTQAAVVGTQVIGVIVSERYLDENQSYYWKFYQGISTCAVHEGCLAVLETVTEEEEERIQVPKVIEDKKADGIVILGAFHREYMHMINRMSLPKIFLDAHLLAEPCDAVVSDNEVGSCLLTDRLFELGHEKIGFVGTPNATTSIDERFLGYIRSHLRHGRQVEKSLVVLDRDRLTGDVNYEKYFQLPDQLPTAFVCNCDLSAVYLIRKLAERGLRVPEDISVTGFDNYVPGVNGTDLSLLTYENDLDTMVQRTVFMIKRKMNRKRHLPGTVVVTGRHIEGNSVRRIGDPIPFA